MISTCISPKKLRNNGLGKMGIGDHEISKYIVEEIMYPLEETLCTAYEIGSHTLHNDILRVKESPGASPFDHENEDQQKKYNSINIQSSSPLIPESLIGNIQLSNGLSRLDRYILCSMSASCDVVRGFQLQA